MTEINQSSQVKTNPRRPDDNIGAAASPEKHLLDVHKLSIKLQGKEGKWGHAVWSLTRESRGKTRTLAVFEGTRLESAHHFFHYIHPDWVAATSAPTRRPNGRYQPRPRTGRPTGRPQSRPQSRPQGRS